MSGRTTDEMIEVYVSDVVRNLMPKFRGDVAFELRALLHEELQQKAREAGRLPDEEMTLAYLRAFGRPADVAARYHQPITLIEPADTPAFLLLSIIGVSFASALPYVDRLRGQDVVIRDWPESLWVVGLLVIVFAVMGYMRRRWPQKNMWRPHRLHTDLASPVRTVFAVFFGVLALAIYAFPVESAALFRLNDLSPAFTPEAFAYTENFRTWRFPWLFALGVPMILFNVYSLVRGRWTKVVRWLEIMFSISLAIQLGWHAHVGHIAVGREADDLVRVVFLIAEISTLVQAGIRAWREWGRIDAPQGLPGGPRQQSPA
jgi:hypothetical protein